MTRILRNSLALLPILFLSAAVIMLFFTHLAGINNHNPLNRIFFLQADTRNIPGAPPISHWTLYNICEGSHNGRNIHCTGRHAATPMLPTINFQTAEGIPHGFTDKPNKFYYLSRFFYAFSIISLFFVICALALSFLAFCSYLGAALAAIITFVALFFLAFTTCIMTAVYTMAQNAFRDEGRFARVGAKAFAFMWTSLFLVFVSMIMLTMSYMLGHHKRKLRKRGCPAHEFKNPPMMSTGRANFALNSGLPTGGAASMLSTAPVHNGIVQLNRDAQPRLQRKRHRLAGNFPRGGFFRPGPQNAPDTPRPLYEKIEPSPPSTDSGVFYDSGLVNDVGTGNRTRSASQRSAPSRPQTRHARILSDVESSLPSSAAFSPGSEHHDHQYTSHQGQTHPVLNTGAWGVGMQTPHSHADLDRTTTAATTEFNLENVDSSAVSPAGYIESYPTRTPDETIGVPMGYIRSDPRVHSVYGPGMAGESYHTPSGSERELETGNRVTGRERKLSVQEKDFVV